MGRLNFRSFGHAKQKPPRTGGKSEDLPHNYGRLPQRSGADGKLAGGRMSV